MNEENACFLATVPGSIIKVGLHLKKRKKILVRGERIAWRQQRTQAPIHVAYDIFCHEVKSKRRFLMVVLSDCRCLTWFPDNLLRTIPNFWFGKLSQG